MSVPGSEFNDFLFAPIGEDRNGMLVSVLSGLARSDVDPWQEAAKLAQLPGEAATKELAALIGALPDGAGLVPGSSHDRHSPDCASAAPVGARVAGRNRRRRAALGR